MCKRNERVLRLNTNHDGCSLCVKMLGQFSSFWSQLISRGHTEKFGRHLSRKIDFVHVIIQTSAVTHYAFSNTPICICTHAHTHTHTQIRDSTKRFSTSVTSIRWQRWFMETLRQSLWPVRCMAVYTMTRALLSTTVLPSLFSACTHTCMRTHSMTYTLAECAN